MALAEAIESIEDPTVKAKLRAQLDRVQRERLEVEAAQQVRERAVEAARTEAEKEAEFVMTFTARQKEIDPDFDFDTWKRESAERSAKDRALRQQIEKYERAAAARWVDPQTLPKKKRRRRNPFLPAHVMFASNAEVDAYERELDRQRGRYTAPVSLI